MARKATRELSEFGIYVKSATKERGITQRKLSEMVGVHEMYLVDVMYGSRPGTQLQEKVKKCLNGIKKAI